MTFHSTVFLLFFAGFLLVDLRIRHQPRWRNAFIVAASYLFYGWWDVRFLALLAGTSLVDYALGLALGRHPLGSPRRRSLLLVSLISNLGVLGFFKYFNFFADSVRAGLLQFGIDPGPVTLQVVLPVGISFYTFQSLSYTLDVYRGDLEPCRDPVRFLAFVSFFPQLVAGPIERATHLLPQFDQARSIRASEFRTGWWWVLWGFFKKVCVADQLGPTADLAFDLEQPSAWVVLLGTLAFALQIYCDFSGYSDIARGIALWLGFTLMENFRFPYFAANIQEFWRRWHVSLSTWFRDYLYRPLGGNRVSPQRTSINLLVVMVVAGLWHGAAWHFVIWGFWHGLGLVVHRGFTTRGWIPQATWARLGSLVITQLFVAYGWILFRSESMTEAIRLTRGLANFENPVWLSSMGLATLGVAVPFLMFEGWLFRSGGVPTLGRSARLLLEGFLLVSIVACWERVTTPFIYFQF